MKTHLATFLLCLVTAAFAEVTEQPAAELFRHKMPKASLSFGYPKEFQYLENRSNETKAVFAGKLDGKVVFFTVLTRIPDDIFTEFPDSVAHARFTERYTLEAAADLIRGSYSPPPKFLSQAYQKLGSLPCVALEHTHLSTDPRKPGWSHRLYGFTRIAQWNRLGIIVSLHCEPEDAERFRATMTAIFASFEFTNQPPSPAVVDFLAGKVTKFSTRGHPKAKEAVFTLKIPAGWSHREAERPNIVQKFVFSADGCTDTVMIITKSFPSEVPFTPKYAKELLAPSELKDSIPEGSTFVTATATKNR